MKSFARLGRVLGIGVLGLVVVMAGSRITPPQSAEAATLTPLAGTWLPELPNAAVTSLHITVQVAFNLPTNSIERRYVVDAAGRHGGMGVATAPVPASPSGQIDVVFHTNPCQPATPHCIPSFLPSTTDITISPTATTLPSCSQSCRVIVVKFVTRSIAGTNTGGEFMTQVL